MPWVKIIAAGIRLIGGGAGIKGTVVISKNHLHIVATVIHIGWKREIYGHF